jgi:hypothetical protein
MGLIPRFTQAQVTLETAKALYAIEDSIIRLLRFSGEEFVKNARNAVNIDGAFPKGDYTDRTNALRSSIGFVVMKDGELLYDGFEGDNPTGVQAAKDAVSRVPKGDYQLIGVAGMDYASYLEAMGYNVITSQALQALVMIEKRGKAMAKRYRERKGVNFDAEFTYTGVSSGIS